MANDYNVGLTYSSEVVDERGLRDQIVFIELNSLAAKHSKGNVSRGNFPGMQAHEGFTFFNLEEALEFMRDTCDKPYIISQILVREDRYKEILRNLQKNKPISS